MAACEKCWADAYTRMMHVNPMKSQTEHYRELLEERKDNPCPAPSLASSTGFSPPLVPEETVHRVVPSGGEIGAPSGGEQWTARERDLYFENRELKHFLSEARKAAVVGIWASRPGGIDGPYKECIICGAKCGEEAVRLWHHETCWANEYEC